MPVDQSIFKSYDIRGIYPHELNEDVVTSVGRAFVTLLEAKQVVVGRDMRLSGPALHQALVNGLTTQGADVLDAGMISVDQFSYACGTTKLPGIMLTASHNPPEYNGMKMVKKIPQFLGRGSGMEELQQLVTAGVFTVPSKSGVIQPLDVRSGYQHKVLSLIKPDELRPMRVIADTGNGMVGPILGPLFAALPMIGFSGLFLDPDGRAPNHGFDPRQAENRQELERRVTFERADLGLAFDGDGDRLFVIDDRGRVVPGDFIAALLGQYFLQHYPGATIICDVRSSWAVRDLVAAAGGTTITMRAGHTHIKQRLAETQAVFAAETSGHFYFRDFFGSDTAVVAALHVFAMLSHAKQPLSALLAPLEEKYFLSGEINTPITADAESKLKQIAAAYPDAMVDWTDGVSLTFPTWHCNIRGSNTEPLLRMNCEAKSQTEMEHRRDELLKIIAG